MPNSIPTICAVALLVWLFAMLVWYFTKPPQETLVDTSSDDAIFNAVKEGRHDFN
jgi:uncharacterized membrane protein YqiK